jgi:hypothetical protein
MGDLAQQSGGADGGRSGSGVEKQSGNPVIIEAAILLRVLEAHVRQRLDALTDLRVNLG